MIRGIDMGLYLPIKQAKTLINLILCDVYFIKLRLLCMDPVLLICFATCVDIMSC